MSKAIYGGSFDPITNGHIVIINQAIMVFDKVIIMVASNPDKKYMFTVEEREQMIIDTFPEDIKAGSVEVMVLPEGEVLVEKAYDMEIYATIRGLRSQADYVYELDLAATNSCIQPRVKTIMFITEPGTIYASSSRLKMLVKLDVEYANSFAPSRIVRAIKRKIKEE